MVATGELIRSMNYVDDIAATLRRIVTNIPGMAAEERQRLAVHLRAANVTITAALEQLEKTER